MLRSVLVLGILLILNGLISGDFVKYEITDPWMVKIKFSSEDMEFGGTFVHENFILTKATVFLNNLINSNEATIMDFEVFMFRRNFTNKNVVEIFFHEDYNKKLLLQDRFDFALVKIDLDCK